MAKNSKKSFPIIKAGIFLFLIFQFALIFSPPALDDSTIATASRITLEQLLQNIDIYVDKPVIIDQVRVIAPTYFYLGSSYYIESIETGSRVLVLSRDFPPKEGTLITILGVIHPVFSAKKLNLAYFKPVEVSLDGSLEALL